MSVLQYMSLFRQEQMGALHASIRKFFPTVRVLVGDDTYAWVTHAPRWAKHPNTTLVALPTDAGLAFGRNLLVQMVETPFLVVLEDDFVFTKVRTNLTLFLFPCSTSSNTV